LGNKEEKGKDITSFRNSLNIRNVTFFSTLFTKKRNKENKKGYVFQGEII